MSLDQSVNISASVGTWLGSLFTGIGLVAVISQLSAFVSSTSARQGRFISRAAGGWSACFLNKQILQGEGEVREAAPALAGWIQKRYLEAGVIKLMQSDTRACGTSSWSRYFAQCHISPQKLIQDGGPAARVYPTGSDISRTPTQADMRIEDGKLLYGLSSAEFAAVLILGGFSTADFSSKQTSSSVKYLGRMHLADHGVFSQIAHFDAHTGTKVMEVETERLVHNVPVQSAIHVALGILKLAQKRHWRQWILVPQHCPVSEAWSTLPLAGQLNAARYNLEQLVMVSGGSIIAYSNQAASELERERDFMINLVGQPGPLRFHEALMAAYAIDALVPWGLLPVAPEPFARALETLLSPFVASRKDTIDVLIQRLQCMPAAVSRPREKGWRDLGEQVESLNRIGDVTTEYFCHSSNYCAYYYDTMVTAFEYAALSMQSVRQTLAALVAWQVLHPDTPPYAGVHEKRSDDNHARVRFLHSMLSHLGNRPPPPPSSEFKEQADSTWAVKIYSTYIWAWLHDRQHIDDDIVSKFHRRVFFE